MLGVKSMSNYTYGMKCPDCEEHIDFNTGGTFAPDYTAISVSCSCGFKTMIVVPAKGYEVEYRIIKKENKNGNRN